MRLKELVESGDPERVAEAMRTHAREAGAQILHTRSERLPRQAQLVG